MILHFIFQYHSDLNTLSINDYRGIELTWHRPNFQPPNLFLRVNYGHDWVESFYEAGYTIWVTVAESDGLTSKAIAEISSDESGYFQTPPESWDPIQPDIQPGDWVYVWVNNGATAKVQIGNISGMIDFETNSITGIISAPWFESEPEIELEVECHSWGADLPEEILVYDSVRPDGTDEYSCQWNEEDWDIQPGQDVGVAYTGLDGHWVANAFYSNARFVASVVGDWLWTSEFTPNASVIVSVYESKELRNSGAGPILEETISTDESGFGAINFADSGLSIQPENYITVSDSAALKGLVLEFVSVEIFDIQDDFMAGYAPLGAEVWAAAGPQEWQERINVQADLTSGEWSADFATTDFDITEEMQPWSYAQIIDDDGDANEGDPPPLAYWVTGYIYDLPSNYWSEGTHIYSFDTSYSYPREGSAEEIPPFDFLVASDKPVYEGYVLTRPYRLRICPDGVPPAGEELPYIDPPEINPTQMTRFVYGWIMEYPMTFAEAQANLDTVTVTVSWDDGEPVELDRLDTMLVDDWFAYLCALTSP